MDTLNFPQRKSTQKVISYQENINSKTLVQTLGVLHYNQSDYTTLYEYQL